jgi:hypothetical protein
LPVNIRNAKKIVAGKSIIHLFMARRKRKSLVLEKALKRKAVLESIDPNLDLGNGLTL